MIYVRRLKFLKTLLNFPGDALTNCSVYFMNFVQFNFNFA